MAKKSFAMDTTSLSTEKPLLDNGVYAGVICNATTKVGQNDTIEVIKEKKWNRNTRQSEETGNYIIGGRLQYGVTLTSKKAAKVLQRDEPRIFGGQIYINFDTETWKMADSHVLGQLLQALGLHGINFSEAVEWEWDDNIEVPEELASVPDIVDMLNSVAYHRAFFGVIANSINGQPVLAKVVKEPNYKTPEVLENVLDMGSRNAPFCGILPYTEGAEDDLEDGE